MLNPPVGVGELFPRPRSLMAFGATRGVRLLFTAPEQHLLVRVFKRNGD